MLPEVENNQQLDEKTIEEQPPYSHFPALKDWLFRFILFLLGFLGLELITILIALIVGKVNSEYLNETSPLYVTGNMIINAIRYTILFVLFVLLLLPRLRIIARKFKNWKTDLIGLAFGVGLILIDMLYSTIVSNFIDMGVNANQELAVKMIKEFPVLSIIILGFFGPICEEITYRYGLFGMIKKKNKILAYIIVVIVFSLIHFDFTADLKIEFINLPSYLIAGVGLCLAYDLFGFNASIIAHIVNNVFACIMNMF